MKKELGTIQALFPMPFAEERVLDERGKVDPCKKADAPPQDVRSVADLCVASLADFTPEALF